MNAILPSSSQSYFHDMLFFSADLWDLIKANLDILLAMIGKYRCLFKVQGSRLYVSGRFSASKIKKTSTSGGGLKPTRTGLQPGLLSEAVQMSGLKPAGGYYPQTLILCFCYFRGPGGVSHDYLFFMGMG